MTGSQTESISGGFAAPASLKLPWKGGQKKKDDISQTLDLHRA